jgi:hypothetical protein
MICCACLGIGEILIALGLAIWGLITLRWGKRRKHRHGR